MRPAGDHHQYDHDNNDRLQRHLSAMEDEVCVWSYQRAIKKHPKVKERKGIHQAAQQ